MKSSQKLKLVIWLGDVTGPTFSSNVLLHSSEHHFAWQRKKGKFLSSAWTNPTTMYLPTFTTLHYILYSGVHVRHSSPLRVASFFHWTQIYSALKTSIGFSLMKQNLALQTRLNYCLKQNSNAYSMSLLLKFILFFFQICLPSVLVILLSHFNGSKVWLKGHQFQQ